MRKLTLLTALGATLGGVAPAIAADMLLPAPPVEHTPGLAIAELGAGWYLRGDIGYVEYAKPGEQRYGAGVPFDAERLKSSFSGGAGFGYKFNNWLRADVTVDYRHDARFDAISSRTGYVEGYSRDSGKISSATALFNAYFDLGTWHGITPYVGAGVGVAQNRFHSYSAQVTCLTPACGDPSPGASYALGPQTPTGVPAGSRTQLAWAVMAGASMEIMPGLLIDAGYRFVHLGEARTKLDQWGVGTRTNDLKAHEVRIGVRYMIE